MQCQSFSNSAETPRGCSVGYSTSNQSFRRLVESRGTMGDSARIAVFPIDVGQNWSTETEDATVGRFTRTCVGGRPARSGGQSFLNPNLLRSRFIYGNDRATSFHGIVCARRIFVTGVSPPLGAGHTRGTIVASQQEYLEACRERFSGRLPATFTTLFSE